MVVAGVVRIKLVEKGLSDVTGGCFASQVRILHQVGYWNAVVPVVHIELLVDHGVEQAMHPHFEHYNKLLSFEKRHEIIYVLFREFSWEPKHFRKPYYFVKSFNTVRLGVQFVAECQLDEDVDCLAALVELVELKALEGRWA